MRRRVILSRIAFAACVALAANCEDPSLTRLPKKGDIHGHVCNPDTQIFVGDANVTLTAKNENGSVLQTYAATSDEVGYWALKDVYEGTHTIVFEKTAIGFYNERQITVVAETDTSIEFSECVVPAGNITGRICDERIGWWVADARVYVEINSGLLETTTDQDGRFALSEVPEGARTVVVRKGEFTRTYDVTVVADQTVEVGDTECIIPATGDLRGRICAYYEGGSDGYWLADARVYIQIGDMTLETTTDSTGWFTLEDIPAGEYTVHVERSSFNTSFEVTIYADMLNELPEPMCIDPSRFRMAVVTGMYDKIEEILYELGFKAKERFDDTHYPTPQLLDNEGTITLIAGLQTDFYLTFLSDMGWMSQFDIIFFNCGLEDIWFSGTPTARENLTTFVEQGGSIYVSDWAYELLRETFAGDNLDGYGSEDVWPPAARVGVKTAAQPARIIDVDLAAALGDPTPADGMPVEINFNLDYYAVMESVATQQALGSKVWVKGDVQIHTDPGTQTFTDAALMVSFQPGESAGNVVYTSFHNYVGDQGVTSEMKLMLKYIIFEL